MRNFDKNHQLIKTLKKGKVITRAEAKDLQMINAICEAGAFAMFDLFDDEKRKAQRGRGGITDIPFEEVK